MSLMNKLSPQFKRRFQQLLDAKAIQIKGDEYFFGTKEDPNAEQPKTEVEVIEYVVWNTAAMFYKYGDNV